MIDIEQKPFLGDHRSSVTRSKHDRVVGHTALLPHQRGLDKLFRAYQT
jgi:hypothetical protein